MKTLDKLRHRVARLIAPANSPRVAVRAYQSSRGGSLTNGWGTSNTSADSELASSLTSLRSRSRALVRDSSYAKRARQLVVNNVIGNGIGLQAQVTTSRGAGLNERVNTSIEESFREWSAAEYCHTGGQLHFCDFERAAWGEVFEAGEVFIRIHQRAFGGAKIPMALELIEAERIADEFQFPALPGTLAAGNILRMGVEMDGYYRPVAYWVRERHPSEFRVGVGQSDRLERVPADQIIHLRVINRWPQTRGEPWLHTAIRKLNDMDGYTEAEIVAARGAANYLATIETPEGDVTSFTATSTSGKPEFNLEPGSTYHLQPGEKLNFVSPNRPNAAMDPFMRYMLREVAAGTGVSYESLSRDYSQSNYSSSRLALLDDRDMWRVYQGFWIRNFRQRLHAAWMQQAVLSRAIPGIGVEDYANNTARFNAVAYKPRGWSWVDPTREVEAYIKAVRAGFMTVADVIALTGGGQDLEDVLTQRQRELEMMESMGLKFDTHTDADAAGEKAAAPPEPDQQDDEEDTTQDPPARVFSIGR